eukprot:251226_1
MYNFKKMKNIYTIANSVYQKHKLHITLQWTQRGLWRGNNKADDLAKRAVDDNLESPSLPQSKPEYISEKRMKNLLKKEKHKINQKDIQSMNKLSVISRNMDIWHTYSHIYDPKIDFKLLTKGQLSIITKLRTQHIKLNWYQHKYNHYQYYKTQYQQFGCINVYKQCTQTCCA